MNGYDYRILADELQRENMALKRDREALVAHIKSLEAKATERRRQRELGVLPDYYKGEFIKTIADERDKWKHEALIRGGWEDEARVLKERVKALTADLANARKGDGEWFARCTKIKACFGRLSGLIEDIP